MPMGALNEFPTFVAMMMKLKIEWDTTAKERGLKICIKNYFYDMLIYGRTSEQLLVYLRTVMDVLKHHPATIKLTK